MSSRQRILDAFQRALDRMAERGKDELTEQGHVASGRSRESIEGQITNDNLNLLVGVVLAEEHLLAIDTGVPANRIPYSRSGTGSGGTSQYIQKLLEWSQFVKPGLSFSDRKKFVFAVANKAKQTGHPTPGSFSFSQNGRRTGWIANAFETDEAQDEFEKALDAAAVLAEDFLASLP